MYLHCSILIIVYSCLQKLLNYFFNPIVNYFFLISILGFYFPHSTPCLLNFLDNILFSVSSSCIILTSYHLSGVVERIENLDAKDQLAQSVLPARNLELLLHFSFTQTPHLCKESQTR